MAASTASAQDALGQTGRADAGRASQANPSQQSQLEEIVVTARKTNELLQSTPVAITAITSEMLTQKALVDLRDIANVSPSLTVAGNNQFGEFPVAIRGISASSSGIGADDPVAVYLDGVYIGRPAGTFFDFGDTERIEVLRGPQGTLYGRNATAGAINIITKQPGDTLEGQVYAGYGSFDTVRTNAWIAGPITSSMSAKLSGFYSKSEGFETNLFDGGRINAVENYGARLAFKIDPVEDLSITIAGDYTHQEDPAAFHQLAPGPFFWNAVNVNENVQSIRDLGGVAATAELSLGAYSVKSITALRSLKLDYVSDSDAGPTLQARNSAAPLKQNQFSQELQLLSDPGQPFSWIGGLYYFHERSTVAIIARNAAGPTLNIRDRNETNSYAAFAQGNLELIDGLKLTAGIRYSHDKKEFLLSNNDGRGGVFVVAPRLSKQSWSAWTPHVSLNYQVTPATLIYANVTRGYKSGGFNFASVQPPFDPEYVWDYEAGIKSDLFDRRVRLNASVFRYDYTNLQVRQNPLPGVIQILNAGKSKIQGVELEGSILPVTGLRFDFGGSYIDAKYTQFTFGAANFAGNRLQRSPKVQGYLTGSYSADIGLGTLSGALTVRHQSRIFFTETNNPVLSQRSHTDLDARIALELKGDGRLTLSVIGKNLTDERYLTNGLIIGPFNVVAVNQPRSFLGEVRYRF